MSKVGIKAAGIPRNKAIKWFFIKIQNDAVELLIGLLQDFPSNNAGF
jgi:hypothetical protein